MYSTGSVFEKDLRGLYGIFVKKKSALHFICKFPSFAKKFIPVPDEEGLESFKYTKLTNKEKIVNLQYSGELPVLCLNGEPPVPLCLVFGSFHLSLATNRNCLLNTSIVISQQNALPVPHTKKYCTRWYRYLP
jgi:hypothetical protein